jgi:hypothetical protein
MQLAHRQLPRPATPPSRLLSRRPGGTGILPAPSHRCVRYSWHTASCPAPLPATPSRLLSRRPDGADILPAPSYLPSYHCCYAVSGGHNYLHALLPSLLRSEARGHDYFTTAHPKTQPRPNLDAPEQRKKHLFPAGEPSSAWRQA